MKLPAVVPEVSGARLLELCGYDSRLAGIVVALQDAATAAELLETTPEHLRRNVEHCATQVRKALGR